MLIDYDFFDVVQTGVVIGFFVIAMLLLIAAIWKKRLLFAGSAALALLLSFASIMLRDFIATPTFVATEDGHAIQIHRALLFGNWTYRLSDGRRASLHMQRRPEELVVNDTTTALVIVPIAYSIGGFMRDPDKVSATVEPFEVSYTKLWIQYFGLSDHKPPTTVMIAGGGGELRYWLTWE